MADNGKNDKNVSNDPEELKKSGSSYYLYKSTDKEEAKKYAPKKLDSSTAQNIEKEVQQKAVGSTWNTGATMEQFDYSEWMKKRLKSLLLNLKFDNSSIRISEIVKIEGSATILLVRGKYRPGYDISFECKYKGFTDPNLNDNNSSDDNDDDKEKEDKNKNKNKTDDKKGDKKSDKKDEKKTPKKEKNKKKSYGLLKMNEITSEDDADDWEYEVSIKKKTKPNKAGLKIVKNGRKQVLDAIDIFIKELFSKKK